MQIGKNQVLSGIFPSVNKIGQTKLPAQKDVNEKINVFKEDNSNLASKSGNAVTNMNIMCVEPQEKLNEVDESNSCLENKPAEKEKPVAEDICALEETPDGQPEKGKNISNFSSKTQTSNRLKLTGIDIGSSILNDSNMFVKNEDDLGMTTSYTAGTNFSFLNNNDSKTNIFINNSSALHTQFLSKENSITNQSLLTTKDFEVGFNNNSWLLKNPNFSTGAKIQFKDIDTNTSSGWANVQKGLHNFANLRQYQNQENPFVSDESYLTPMITMDFEKEKIVKEKLYFKTEVKTAVGPMIPMQQNSKFYTPVRADAYSSVKIGYSYMNHPLIYLKADGNISNEPLPYNRDQGTLGVVGVAIGNEIPLMKREKVDVTLFLESKVLKPYGNLPNNPLPDQSGKHDIIHEMFNVKLRINFK